jgi:hypothetical protein
MEARVGNRIAQGRAAAFESNYGAFNEFMNRSMQKIRAARQFRSITFGADTFDSLNSYVLAIFGEQ